MPSDKTLVTWGWGGREEQEGLITEEAFGAMETFILIAVMASQVYVCESSNSTFLIYAVHCQLYLNKAA